MWNTVDSENTDALSESRSFKAHASTFKGGQTVCRVF